MVKSILKKQSYFNFFILTLFLCVSALTAYTIAAVVFFKSTIIPRGSLPKEGALLFICIFSLLSAFIINILLTHPMNITIDTSNQKIIYAHIFFPIKKTYPFSCFSYCFETLEHNVGRDTKAVYLVKNNRLQETIRAYYYSNYSEMHDALKGITDHGFIKLSTARVLRLYFWKNIKV
ncbi:MAG: hypothetical protein JST86_12200 [Bacteroidetes bacterium]|nr:hypothetical protein [Bacteroidota bacterium]